MNAPNRHEALARQLVDRMSAAPVRGRVTRADRREAAGATDPAIDESGGATTARVMRGHAISDTVFVRARRRKTELRVAGRRVTWSEVLCDGIARLALCDPSSLPPSIDDARRLRMVQAMLPVDVDRTFVALQLTFDPVDPMSHQRMWEAAIELWLESTADAHRRTR